MRRLMFITLMAALWAWGAAADAALYRWKQQGASDDWRHFYTDSPSCASVISKWEKIGPLLLGVSIPTSDANMAYTYAFHCSFDSVPEVGSTVSIALHVPSASLSWQTLELAQILDDAPSSEVASMPVQRVLVLLGGALMLGLGVGVGRIR